MTCKCFRVMIFETHEVPAVSSWMKAASLVPNPTNKVSIYKGCMLNSYLGCKSGSKPSISVHKIGRIKPGYDILHVLLDDIRVARHWTRKLCQPNLSFIS